jgi:hypothetical protein
MPKANRAPLPSERHPPPLHSFPRDSVRVPRKVERFRGRRTVECAVVRHRPLRRPQRRSPTRRPRTPIATPTFSRSRSPSRTKAASTPSASSISSKRHFIFEAKKDSSKPNRPPPARLDATRSVAHPPCERLLAALRDPSARVPALMLHSDPTILYFRCRFRNAGGVPSSTSTICLLIVGFSIAPASYSIKWS